MHRTLPTSFLLWLCLLVSAFAEQAPRIALNILSMIPSDESPCIVTLGGRKIHPEGLTAGVETGWFSMPRDKLELSAEHPDGERLTDTIPTDGSSARIIVIYLQSEAKTEGKHPTIRFAVFPAFTTGTKTRKLVSLCENEESFFIGNTEAKLKPLTPADASLWEPEGFTVSHQDNAIARIGEIAKESSCYLFISRGRDGAYQAAIANADQLELGR